MSTVELGFLTLWEIPEDYPPFSDHELILLCWEDINYDLPDKEIIAATDWDLQGLDESPNNLQSAYTDWVDQSKGRGLLDHTSDQKDLDKEVEWLEENLAEVLNTYAKILRVTSFSKQYRNKKVAEAGRT